MDLLTTPLGELEVWAWESFLDDWVFVVATGFFALELLRYGLFKKLSWNLIGDAASSYVTLAMNLGLGYLLYGALYVAAFFYAYRFAIFQIDGLSVK